MGEQTGGFSQARGDDPQTAESGGPGCPRSQGDRALLEVVGPASVSGGATVNAVLCLKRLQPRSDARQGTKRGVGCDDAMAVLALPVCVRARPGRRGPLGVQEVPVGQAHGRVPGTSTTGWAGAAQPPRAGLSSRRFVRGPPGSGWQLEGSRRGQLSAHSRTRAVRGWREADTFRQRCYWRSPAGFCKAPAGTWNEAERPLAGACRPGLPGAGCRLLQALWDQPWVQGRGVSPPRWSLRKQLQDHQAPDQESGAASVKGSFFRAV